MNAFLKLVNIIKIIVLKMLNSLYIIIYEIPRGGTLDGKFLWTEKFLIRFDFTDFVSEMNDFIST